MTHHIQRSACTAALAAILSLTVNAADRPHVDSTWRTTPITVDGHQDDWAGALTPLGTEPVSIQAVNDTDALYLRLTASEPAVRSQILRSGLIVWFDDEGGTKKRFGIHFPVIEQGRGGERGGRGGYGRDRRPRGESEGARDDYEPPNRVDILGPGKNDARSLTLDHAQGVEVALHVVEGTVSYELKVPLTKTADHPYALNVSPGKTVGVGLETPKIERPSGGPGGFGRGGGGGMGGGGMSGRGMPGGSRRSGDREFQPPKPIKIWATLTLSGSPAR